MQQASPRSLPGFQAASLAWPMGKRKRYRWYESAAGVTIERQVDSGDYAFVKGRSAARRPVVTLRLVQMVPAFHLAAKWRDRAQAWLRGNTCAAAGV